MPSLKGEGGEISTHQKATRLTSSNHDGHESPNRHPAKPSQRTVYSISTTDESPSLMPRPQHSVSPQQSPNNLRETLNTNRNSDPTMVSTQNHPNNTTTEHPPHNHYDPSHHNSEHYTDGYYDGHDMYMQDPHLQPGDPGYDPNLDPNLFHNNYETHPSNQLTQTALQVEAATDKNASIRSDIETLRDTRSLALSKSVPVGLDSNRYTNHITMLYNKNAIPFIIVLIIIWTLLLANDIVAFDFLREESDPIISSSTRLSSQASVAYILMIALRGVGLLILLGAGVIITVNMGLPRYLEKSEQAAQHEIIAEDLYGRHRTTAASSTPSHHAETSLVTSTTTTSTTQSHNGPRTNGRDKRRYPHLREIINVYNDDEQKGRLHHYPTSPPVDGEQDNLDINSHKAYITPNSTTTMSSITSSSNISSNNHGMDAPTLSHMNSHHSSRPVSLILPDSDSLRYSFAPNLPSKLYSTANQATDNYSMSDDIQRMSTNTTDNTTAFPINLDNNDDGDDDDDDDNNNNNGDNDNDNDHHPSVSRIQKKEPEQQQHHDDSGNTAKCDDDVVPSLNVAADTTDRVFVNPETNSPSTSTSSPRNTTGSLPAIAMSHAQSTTPSMNSNPTMSHNSDSTRFVYREPPPSVSQHQRRKDNDRLASSIVFAGVSAPRKWYHWFTSPSSQQSIMSPESFFSGANERKSTRKSPRRMFVNLILSQSLSSEYVGIVTTNIIIVLHVVISFLTQSITTVQAVIPAVLLSYLTVAFSHSHWIPLAVQTSVIGIIHVVLTALYSLELHVFNSQLFESHNALQHSPSGYWDDVVLIIALFVVYSYQIYLISTTVKSRTHADFFITHSFKKNEENLLLLLSHLLPSTVIGKYKQNTNISIWERYTSVSIMFIYIDQFDVIAAGLRASQLVWLLNVIFTNIDVLTSAYRRYGVYKIETIGEVYMLSCGAPYLQPLHADVLSDLALDILAIFSSIHRNTPAKIGIHSGPIVAGIIGLHYPRYRVIGDTVNTSSRMASTAEANMIQISTSTLRRLCSPISLLLWEYEEGVQIHQSKQNKTKLYRQLRKLRENKKFYTQTAFLGHNTSQRHIDYDVQKPKAFNNDIEMGSFYPSSHNDSDRTKNANGNVQKDDHTSFLAGQIGYNSHMSGAQKQLAILIKEKLYKKYLEKYNDNNFNVTAEDCTQYNVRSLGAKQVKGKGLMVTWQLLSRAILTPRYTLSLSIVNLTEDEEFAGLDDNIEIVDDLLTVPAQYKQKHSKKSKGSRGDNNNTTRSDMASAHSTLQSFGRPLSSTSPGNNHYQQQNDCNLEHTRQHFPHDLPQQYLEERQRKQAELEQQFHPSLGLDPHGPNPTIDGTLHPSQSMYQGSHMHEPFDSVDDNYDYNHHHHPPHHHQYGGLPSSHSNLSQHTSLSHFTGRPSSASLLYQNTGNNGGGGVGGAGIGGSLVNQYPYNQPQQQQYIQYGYPPPYPEDDDTFHRSSFISTGSAIIPAGSVITPSASHMPSKTNYGGLQRIIKNVLHDNNPQAQQQQQQQRQSFYGRPSGAGSIHLDMSKYQFLNDHRERMIMQRQQNDPYGQNQGPFSPPPQLHRQSSVGEVPSQQQLQQQQQQQQLAKPRPSLGGYPTVSFPHRQSKQQRRPAPLHSSRANATSGDGLTIGMDEDFESTNSRATALTSAPRDDHRGMVHSISNFSGVQRRSSAHSLFSGESNQPNRHNHHHHHHHHHQQQQQQQSGDSSEMHHQPSTTTLSPFNNLDYNAINLELSEEDGYALVDIDSHHHYHPGGVLPVGSTHGSMHLPPPTAALTRQSSVIMGVDNGASDQVKNLEWNKIVLSVATGGAASVSSSSVTSPHQDKRSPTAVSTKRMGMNPLVTPVSSTATSQKTALSSSSSSSSVAPSDHHHHHQQQQQQQQGTNTMGTVDLTLPSNASNLAAPALNSPHPLSVTTSMASRPSSAVTTGSVHSARNVPTSPTAQSVTSTTTATVDYTSFTQHPDILRFAQNGAEICNLGFLLQDKTRLFNEQQQLEREKEQEKLKRAAVQQQQTSSSSSSSSSSSLLHPPDGVNRSIHTITEGHIEEDDSVVVVESISNAAAGNTPSLATPQQQPPQQLAHSKSAIDAVHIQNNPSMPSSLSTAATPATATATTTPSTGVVKSASQPSQPAVQFLSSSNPPPAAVPRTHTNLSNASSQHDVILTPSQIELKKNEQQLVSILGMDLQTFVDSEKQHSDDEIIDNATNVQSYYMKGRDVGLFFYPSDPSIIIQPLTLDYYSGRPRDRFTIQSIFWTDAKYQRFNSSEEDDDDYDDYDDTSDDPDDDDDDDDDEIGDESDDSDHPMPTSNYKNGHHHERSELTSHHASGGDNDREISYTSRRATSRARSRARSRNRRERARRQYRSRVRFEESITLNDRPYDDDDDDDEQVHGGGNPMNMNNYNSMRRVPVGQYGSASIRPTSNIGTRPTLDRGGKNTMGDDDANSPTSEHSHQGRTNGNQSDDDENDSDGCGHSCADDQKSPVTTTTTLTTSGNTLVDPNNTPTNQQPRQLTRRRDNVHLPKPTTHKRQQKPTFSMSQSCVATLEHGFITDLVVNTHLILVGAMALNFVLTAFVIFPYFFYYQHGQSPITTISHVDLSETQGVGGAILLAIVILLYFGVFGLLFLILSYKKEPSTQGYYNTNGQFIPLVSHPQQPIDRRASLGCFIPSSSESHPTTNTEKPTVTVSVRKWAYNYLLVVIFLLFHAIVQLLYFTGIHATLIGILLIYTIIFTTITYTFITYRFASLSASTVFIHLLIITLLSTDTSTRTRFYCALSSAVFTCVLILHSYIINFNSRRLFISSLHILHDQRQSADLIYKILPSEIVNALSQGDGGHVAFFSSSHSNATVLFADVVNFTHMSAQLQSEELVLFLNIMFSIFDQLSGARGVYKVDTIGDCYFACTNVVPSVQSTFRDPNEPVNAITHAENMVYFAMDIIYYLSLIPHPLASKQQRQSKTKILRALIRHNEQSKQKKYDFSSFLKEDPLSYSQMLKLADAGSKIVVANIQPVNLRVGIHTGDVVAGVVGRTMPRYHLFGKTVSLAQKTESSGYKNRVSISTATRNLLPQAWKVLYRKTMIIEKQELTPEQLQRKERERQERLERKQKREERRLHRQQRLLMKQEQQQKLLQQQQQQEQESAMASENSSDEVDLFDMIKSSSATIRTAFNTPAHIESPQPDNFKRTLSTTTTSTSDEDIDFFDMLRLDPKGHNDLSSSNPSLSRSSTNDKKKYDGVKAHHHEDSTDTEDESTDFMAILRAGPEGASDDTIDMNDNGNDHNNNSKQDIDPSTVHSDENEDDDEDDESESESESESDEVRYLELFTVRGHVDIPTSYWFDDDDEVRWPPVGARANLTYW